MRNAHSTLKLSRWSLPWWEELFLVLIVLAVFGMSGAASFTHVHDWTMIHVPDGTPDWIGWANASITELVPIAAALYTRRCQRRGIEAGWYPYALLISAVTLSISAQIAVAKPNLSSLILSTVPALAFLGLSKLGLKILGNAQPAADAIASRIAAAEDAAQQAAAHAAALAQQLADATAQHAEALAAMAAERDAARAEAETLRAAGVRPVRTAEETFQLAEQIRAEQPEISFAEIAKRLRCSRQYISRLYNTRSTAPAFA